MGADEWATVPGFDGWYDVSRSGDVRTWRVMACHRRADVPAALLGRVSGGYKMVKLTHPVLGKLEVAVSHIVLSTFVEPRPSKMVADHIDRNTLNNSVGNLRWVTSQSNVSMAVHKRPHPREWSAVSSADVIDIRLRRARGETLASIASVYGITFQSVSRIARREVWKDVS